METTQGNNDQHSMMSIATQLLNRNFLIFVIISSKHDTWGTYDVSHVMYTNMEAGLMTSGPGHANKMTDDIASGGHVI